MLINESPAQFSDQNCLDQHTQQHLFCILVIAAWISRQPEPQNQMLTLLAIPNTTNVAMNTATHFIWSGHLPPTQPPHPMHSK